MKTGLYTKREDNENPPYLIHETRKKEYVAIGVNIPPQVNDIPPKKVAETVHTILLLPFFIQVL